MRSSLLLPFLCVLACGGGGTGGDDDTSADGGLAGTLEITPPGAELDVVDGVTASQAFTVELVADDGTRTDVSTQATFVVSNPKLGGFTVNTFTAQGLAAGKGLITATFGGQNAQAPIVVRVRGTRVIDPAPPEAPSWFDSATEDAALAPAIVYPDDGTYVPPNLGDFEVHWMGAGGADLFEVALRSDYLDLRIYTTGPVDAGGWTAFLPAHWSIVGESLRGDAVTVSVRGLASAAPATAGTATPIAVKLTDQDVEGGIYYWAATSSSGAPAGIYRHDMARPGQPAEQFYTTAESPESRCVACHVLSRDGTRMAITLDGGNGAATVLDVGARTPLLAVDGSYAWNFATFTPDGAQLLTVSGGAMSMRAPDTGAVVGTVPTTGYATHPDFAPDAHAITYVLAAAPGQDWHFTGGSVMVQPYDAVTGTFGAAGVLVSGANNNYYPSWSPDSAWVLFNTSTEDAYDDATAELWVVPADGSMAPLRLDSPNVGAGLTNSWARWAPFEQAYGVNSETPERFFWLTFSSKRAFGVRLPAGTPQIWMAPFFPDRAKSGGDPSGPAFRLPFQGIDTSNHIAQWTEQVVPIE